LVKEQTQFNRCDSKSGFPSKFSKSLKNLRINSIRGKISTRLYLLIIIWMADIVVVIMILIAIGIVMIMELRVAEIQFYLTY